MKYPDRLPKRNNAYDGQKAHNDNRYYTVGRIAYNSWAADVLPVADIVVYESELIHIANRHGKELETIGMDVFDFVNFIMENYNAVYQGTGNSYLLVVLRENVSDMAAIELHTEVVNGEEVYRINTAAPIKTKLLYSKTLLCANDR